MKLINSKQRNVKFVWCSSPITIDKRKEWGDSADNLQIGANGAFLKLNGDNSISHLVQPNSDKSAPLGWMVGESGYDKLPIWVEEELIQEGEVVKMNTADGPIEYTTKEFSRVCYNGKNGAPDLNDGWIQTEKNIVKNYEI